MPDESWLIAWLKGYVRWSPSPAVRSEFLIVWAVFGIGAALLVPVAIGWPTAVQGVAVAAGVVAVGAINALFHRLGR